jgi:hypothetical protein
MVFDSETPVLLKLGRASADFDDFLYFYEAEYIRNM